MTTDRELIRLSIGEPRKWRWVGLASYVEVRDADGRPVIEGYIRPPGVSDRVDHKHDRHFAAWASALEATERDAVLALRPGQHELAVTWPARTALRQFLALPPTERTVAEASKRGISVRYPGKPGSSYPVVYGLDGEAVAITRDVATPGFRMRPSDD